jgi:hypothetical protein
MAKKRAPNKENCPPSSRFDFDIDDNDFETMSKPFQPKNTQLSTSWGLKTFTVWVKERNKHKSQEKCPDDVLMTNDKSTLAYWLGRFVTEARRQDGKPYPPKTLHVLLMAIQRHIRTMKPSEPANFFADPEFHVLQNICDTHYRKLHASGVGASTQETSVVSQDDEDKLWENGVINLTTPQGLLNAVFFYNGKNFCLRGGQEHKDLKFSQFQRKVVDIGDGQLKVAYEYTEHGSKNRSGGIKQIRMKNKCVTQYEDAGAGDRCHVTILDRYFLKVPKSAKDKEDFYLRPLGTVPTDPMAPWFSIQPIGRNKLNCMMKTMSIQGGLSVVHTNHSLRSYGATKLFQQKVPEKLIQERTGHRSTEALRKYERISEEQKISTSKMLNGTTDPNQPGPSSSTIAMCNPVASQLCLHQSLQHQPPVQPPLPAWFQLQPSRPYYPQQQTPTYTGCTFTGCTFTVNVVQNTDSYLQGVDVNEIFNDF